MNLDKLPHWLQPLVVSLGGLGLFVVAFLAGYRHRTV